MIDWHISLDSERFVPPPNYDFANDGCGFPNWHYQEFFSSVLHSENIALEPYEDKFFQGENLRNLEQKFLVMLKIFEQSSSIWETLVIDHFQSLDTFQQTNAKPSQMLEKSVALSVIHKTISMIQRAKSLNGGIFFYGD